MLWLFPVHLERTREISDSHKFIAKSNKTSVFFQENILKFHKKRNIIFALLSPHVDRHTNVFSISMYPSTLTELHTKKKQHMDGLTINTA